jgi:hypothetical protein
MPRDVCVVGLTVLPLALLDGVGTIGEDLIRRAIEEIS